MKKPSLIVYKASAGSGKTFTLATEYIKLLVSDPQAYRQILAVTFTNKATEEMKLRILSQLYGISRQLPESHSYAEKVEHDLQATTEFVRERAATALHNLLHNYSYFRVETIDSFFQSVLRNLARELELTSNLRIGLNDVQVEEQAVDQLIENLSTTDQMLQWLLKYIMDSISDDRSWNVIAQIKQFGRTIFRDYYKQQSQRLNEVIDEKGFFDRYQTRLRQERAKAKSRMEELAQAFFDELQQHGLTVADLAYGASGPASPFLKVQQGVFDATILGKRAQDCLDDSSKWFSKKAATQLSGADAIGTSLTTLLQQLADEQPRQWRLYKSADLTLRHLSQLRLLSSIEQKVRQLNEESNRFLLSDTQQLLHDLIDGSDSPFIFEKIGTQLEHIMIDEFQDTSTVQWQNFKVLLEEAMSHEGSENLIVGDVKQSIYRWRSGDWRLLAGIKGEFTNADERLQELPLDTNYRSARRIVDFNNIFFEKAAQLEDVSAYDDVRQKIPASRPDEGSVEVTLLPADDYQQQTLTLLARQVATLLEQGVSATDITILVRTNSFIPLIANFFMEQMPEVSVVSDEAFRLDASPAVVTIIQAMHFLAHSDDTIAGAYLRKVSSGRLDGTLPDGYSADLMQLPLYELAEKLYILFRLHDMQGQSAYLCAFFDYVASFVNDNAADLSAFLREWDETLCSKTIQSPEMNGIRIISIHKAKGLEFPCVLLPFCDWKMEHADILWCQPTEAPFNELPLAPIDFSQKGMKGTIYERDYDEEHQQVTVDNLNLLYVAFTRASQRLYVYGRRGSKSSRSAIIEMTLPEIVDQLQGATISNQTDDKAPLIFSYAAPESSSARTPEKPLKPTTNPFLQTPESIGVDIKPLPMQVTFRQSNRSRDFTSDDDDEQAEQQRYIQLGSVLHQLFSTIRTTDDIDRALFEMEQEGVIYDEQLSRQQLEKLIRKRLADPRVSDFFSPRWKLFNECTILDVDPATNAVYERRPDRVMTDGQRTVVVDFKFGRERDEYHAQVREYMQLLQRMGYPNVSGYLWMVYSNRIVEVSSS